MEYLGAKAGGCRDLLPASYTPAGAKKIGKLRMANKDPHLSTDKGESLAWCGRKASMITVVVRMGLTYHIRGCLGR